MASKPVKPREAASLVVLHRAGGDTEVLLGRREPRHRFMPNVLVFPAVGSTRAIPVNPWRAGCARRWRPGWRRT